MYSSTFVIAAMFVLSAMGNGYGDLPQTGSYDTNPPPQTGYGPPQTPPPQYGSQSGNSQGYDTTGLPPMDYGSEDPPMDPAPCEQDTAARIDNPTCSLQQSCQLGGFCENQPFGLHNPRRSSCMAVECYRSKLTRLTNFLRITKTDPKLRLVTKKCSLGMSFNQKGEHTFGWQAAIGGQVGHLNLVHFPQDGSRLCARRRKWATFFYPCDAHSSKYTLGAVTSKKGTFQIQAQSTSGLRAPGCLTAPGKFGAKVSTQKCGGLFAYKEQQWQKVQCR